MEFINKKFRVFRYEKDGRVAYTIGASKKNKEGKYDNAYKPVRFRKDVNLANKTEIIIKEGWEDFTNYTDGFGATKTKWYYFINKFEMASDMDAIKQVQDSMIQPKEKTYMEQSQEEALNNPSELPFY